MGDAFPCRKSSSGLVAVEFQVVCRHPLRMSARQADTRPDTWVSDREKVRCHLWYEKQKEVVRKEKRGVDTEQKPEGPQNCGYKVQTQSLSKLLYKCGP